MLVHYSSLPKNHKSHRKGRHLREMEAQKTGSNLSSELGLALILGITKSKESAGPYTLYAMENAEQCVEKMSSSLPRVSALWVKRTTFAPLITNRNKIELQDHILSKFSSIDSILRRFLKKYVWGSWEIRSPTPLEWNLWEASHTLILLKYMLHLLVKQNSLNSLRSH